MASRNSAIGGHVVEIFSGVQGEGLFVGRRQIFLRLAGCNLACDYCDQPEAREVPKYALIERIPGRRDFAEMSNPISAFEVAKAVLRLNRPNRLHHALAITGGEPLMHAEFLGNLLPGLRRSGLKILFETNGTLPDALRALLLQLDIVSMDLKLKSATGRPMPVRAHERFLRMAVRSSAQVYVKAVVVAGTGTREIGRAAGLIARVRKSVPLVLQPVSPVSGSRLRPPQPEELLSLQATAARFLDDVRVIPQTHKIMGQR